MICWSIAGVRFVGCSIKVILELRDIALVRPHPGAVWGEQQEWSLTSIKCHSARLHSIDWLIIVGLPASSRGLIRRLSLSLLMINSQHLVRWSWNTRSSHDEPNKKILHLAWTERFFKKYKINQIIRAR